MITERDVIFHVDTGCCQSVLTDRLLKDTDFSTTRSEVEQLISKLVKEGRLYVAEKAINYRYLKVNWNGYVRK